MDSEKDAEGRRETIAEWFGLNRATVAVLAVIGCLGLSEEIWSSFLSLHMAEQAKGATATAKVLEAAMAMGVVSSLKNLLEGFGYLIGGTIAHRMGAKIALAVSGIPTIIGVAIMLSSDELWAIAGASLLMTNWEPISVPATFEVVGSQVAKHRRTIAFAVQSIQKRLPKVIGPSVGGFLFAYVGYWLNLTIAFGLVALAAILQLALMDRMRPTRAVNKVSIRQILRGMPRELRLLLTAEIFIRWGDWFARDFTSLYVFQLLTIHLNWSPDDAKWIAGILVGISNLTALATYVPIAKWVDKSPSPRPFIGLTFLLFSLFPLCLVFLPKLSLSLGMSAVVGLVIAYGLNGLREIGEPARKALISTSFPKEVRARAVGTYWGIRSFAFCGAPFIASLLWQRVGADWTFVIGGLIGIVGTTWYAMSVRHR